MNDVSNKTIFALLVATVVISLGGTYISMSAVNNKLGSLGFGPITGFFAPITGFALIPNATATVTVELFSSIKFTDSSVAFGSGNVNTTGGFTKCALSTVYTPRGCVSFNDVTDGFTIENDGNSNLSVELRSNVTAAQFIGGSSPLFLWNVTVNEAGSCVNASGTSFRPRTAVTPNTSANCATHDACGADFEAVSTSNKNICPSLLFSDSSDTLDIDINITISEDAPEGAKLAGFIVTGTAE